MRPTHLAPLLALLLAGCEVTPYMMGQLAALGFVVVFVVLVVRKNNEKDD